MMRAVPTVPRAAVAVGIALAMGLAGSEAWAQDATPSAGPLGPLSGFIPFLLIFVLFYFLLILPQQRKQKKHRATLEALKKNDKVATNGGIYGTVMSLSKDVVTLEIAPNVRIKIRRDAIADLRTGDDEESK
jgi:preprotein translocase subunit YajC